MILKYDAFEKEYLIIIMTDMKTIQCPHENLRNLSHNVKMCLDCGIFTLKVENSMKKLTMVKPDKYNCCIITNPLVIFKEITKPFIERNQTTANYTELYKHTRQQQIDYLRSLIIKYKATHQCFYLALAYLDKVLGSKKMASYYKCDVITIACFLLALKFNDLDPIIPNYSSFKTSNGKQNIQSSDIYKWEIKSLQILEYNLNLVTSYNIIEILFLGGIAYYDEVYLKPDEFLKNVYSHSGKLIYKVMSNTVITEYYNCVQIAFAVVYISRKIHGLNVYFRKNLMQIYDVHFRSYKECLKDISKYVLNNNPPDQCEVCPTDHSNQKMKIHFDESAMKTPKIKKTSQFLSKLPNIEMTSFMTDNTSNTTVYSAVKHSSVNLFSKPLLTESRNITSLVSEPRSANDLYYLSFRDRVIRPRAKPKSMFHDETIAKRSQLILPKI